MPHTLVTGWRRTDTPKATVFIAIPTYGQPFAETANSLNAAQHDLSAHGYNGYVCWLTGMCHVDDARNNICARFLQAEEATHLMFVDADVTFDANAVRRLLERDEPVSAGVYPFKNDKEGYPVVFKDPHDIKFDDRGMIEVNGVPGGFTCIRRDVVEKLTKINAKKGVWPEKADYDLPVVEIFHRTIEKGRSRRSGDYEFCDKVRRAGFKIWVEPNIQFGHVGTKIWTGNLQDYLQRQGGNYDKRLSEAVHSGKKLDLDDFRLFGKAYDNSHFAADHVLLSVIYDTVAALDKPKVLETGSGCSTLAIMLAGGDCTSLEQSAVWGGKTELFLNKLGMDCPVKYTPIVEKHGLGRWYDAAHLDGEYDVVFCDGPVREHAGMRARICDVMPRAIKGAKVLIVDDVDDGDGRKFLDRLNKEFGFVFDIHDGPRREFAVGTRE